MANNADTTMKFGMKKSKLSVLPIIFSCLVAGGAIAGGALSIWHVSQNYTKSADFIKSVNGRVKVNPLYGYTDEEKVAVTEEQVRQNLEVSAQKLSRWLKDQGQRSYDVTYELYVHEDEHEIDDRYEAYLNIDFDVDQVESKLPYLVDDNEKIDNDPYLSFFANSGFNSNEKTLVYRWYMDDLTTKNDEPYYSVISFRDLFEIADEGKSTDNASKVITNDDAKYGVLFRVKSDASELLSNIYANLRHAVDDSEDEEKTEDAPIKNAWGQPRIYIVNNINGLYNEANYHLSNFFYRGYRETDEDYLKIYKNSIYSDWAEGYKDNLWYGEERPEERWNECFKLASANLSTDTGEKTTDKIPNADIFNYIDQETAGTISDFASFADKYISEIITMDELDTFMPSKIVKGKYENQTDSSPYKISYFWYQQSSETQANKFLNNQVNYGFGRVALAEITFDSKNTAKDVYDYFKTQYRYVEVDPPFTETIFGGNNAIGILSIGFLAFLIALLVILAVLYRTTGVMSWICLMFALSMTLLVASFASTAISMPLIIGMFALVIVGFMGCLAICGRMRRRLNSNEDTSLMIRKTFKKSLLPLVDISFITLIFGICLTYIAPITYNPLGVVLICGSFAIFISIYLINAMLHGLFFNNRIMVNRFEFFGKPTNLANQMLSQGNANIPSSLDATNLTLPYFSTMSKKKIDATGKKALIAIIIVALALAAGVVFFTLLGFVSSEMFHTTTCVSIKFDGDLLAQDWFRNAGLTYTSYRHDLLSNMWYFYTDAENAFSIAQTIASSGGLTMGDTICVGYIFGSTSLDLLNLSLIAIIVATLCTGLYGAIRFNWLSFIPTIIGSFELPVLILGLSALCQIKFDQYVIVGFSLTTIVNAIFTVSILGAISESWNRKEAFDKKEFKFIVNVTLTNSWQFIWVTGLAYILFIGIFGITAPISTSIIQMLDVFGLGAIVTIFVAPFTLSFLTYQFMKIRNFILSKMLLRRRSKIVADYDEIDEQGIEGINKFTKKIPVRIEEKKPDNIPGQKSA